jgi:hypothetical protein
MRWKIAWVVGRPLWSIICRDRNPVNIGMDVDTGGVRVHLP